jgi:hypothetical protein
MAVDIKRYEITAPDKLCWQCDPTKFDFECTKDLAPLGEFIGQDRAIRAIEFGLSMERDGYIEHMLAKSTLAERRLQVK